MVNVNIVQLGPLPAGLKLRSVVNRANGAQQSYFFSLVDPVESTGDPDAEQGQYSFDRLASLLATRSQDGITVLVGVTDHPVYPEMFSLVSKNLSCIIVSTADVRGILDSDRTTATGYVLFEMAAQLLTIEYRRLSRERFLPTECGAPWHRERRGCVFDWDEERKHTGEKMLEPTLCVKCTAALDQANVAASFSTAAIRIAKSGLQPIRAWFRRCSSNPWVVAIGAIVILGIIRAVWSLLSAGLGRPE